MELMKRVVNHTGNIEPLIKNTMVLTYDTMIDKEDFDIINNDFGHSDPFQPGIFGGSLEVDVSIYQKRI